MDTQLEIKRVPLDSLYLDPANTRTHGERNLEAIVASLQRFGQAEPLVIHRGSGRVIGGNGRLVAMQKLGWTECDARTDTQCEEGANLSCHIPRGLSWARRCRARHELGRHDRRGPLTGSSFRRTASAPLPSWPSGPGSSRRLAAICRFGVHLCRRR